MRPLLQELADGRERSTVELRDALARRFQLSNEDLTQLLPSGSGKLFVNRVAWAYVYLQHAGAIERINRGVYKILDRGKELLASHPERIDVSVLKQFPDMEQFLSGSKSTRRREASTVATETGIPPLERMAEARAELEQALGAELLARVKESDPTFFERLVLKVLVSMGYGGSEEQAAEHLGGSGDGGVDGVINEDRLGLDRIYVQAKRRTEGSVGRPEVQGFVGALDGRVANKGVFITSSHFSPDAIDWVKSLSKRVVLIDGQRLAELMIRFDVGVTTRETFSVKEIDEDFFQEKLG